MKYLFLAYGDEQRWNAMPASERDALGSECLASEEALRQSGHLLAVAGLQSSSTAATTTGRSRTGAV